MVDSNVRFRLAPSPTGFMHIGTVRTALYNYLYVKKFGGQFVLRIEDTDKQRFVEGAAEAIYDGLAWVGISPDESPSVGGPFAPYIQSERTPRHREVAEKLLAEEKAYRCFCTKERLAELKENQKKHGLAPQYDRKCRNMSSEEVAAEIAKNTEYTIRFKMPLEGEIHCEDLVRGKMVFDAKDQDDCILMKTDGFATYHLAAMVDDHDMKITHVVRTDEWLPSFAKHVKIIEACGFPMPHFAQPALILNEDRTKMSKRKGPVAVSHFIEAGYLREAIINFLLLIGWSGEETNRELYTLDELIEAFSFDRVSTAPGIFKYEKLDWFNAHYIRSKSVHELEKDIVEYLGYMKNIEIHEDGYTILSLGQRISAEQFKKMVLLAQQKMIKMNEFVPGLDVYFTLADFEKELFFNEKMKVDEATTKTAMEFLRTTLPNITTWDLETIKTTLLTAIAEAGYKNGQILWPMRVALTGLPASPGAFEMADILGKEETLRRIALSSQKMV